jgi:5'-3' exonuclease
MSTTILIDGNSVGYAEHYATTLKAGELQTQAVFGFIRRIRDLRTGYPDCIPVVLWDGRAEWRYQLCPTYKSNRDNDPKKAAIKEAYVAQRPYIARALEHLGVRQMTAATHEADDMAGYLVKKLTATQENRVVLLTGDRDWCQLVRPNVSVRDVRDPAWFLNERNFLDRMGYKTPMAFLEGKALQGDSSDVIPGVGGIGEKGAAEFLATWGSVGSFYKAVDSGQYTPASRASKTAKTLHPEQHLASREGREAFLRNLKMMQLLNVATPKPQDVRVIKGTPDKDKFAELCEELAFSSYLRDLDNFFTPFQN